MIFVSHVFVESLAVRASLKPDNMLLAITDFFFPLKKIVLQQGVLRRMNRVMKIVIFMTVIQKATFGIARYAYQSLDNVHYLRKMALSTQVRAVIIT